MRAADRAQGFDQHIQGEDGGQGVGQQGHAIIAAADALGHDAGAYDSAEQGGGAEEFGQQLLAQGRGAQQHVFVTPVTSQASPWQQCRVR